MHRNTLCLATLVAGVVLGACYRPPAVSGTVDSRPRLQGTDRQNLDSLLPALMAASDIPGMSIAVVRDGRVAWTGAFGVRSLATNARVDDNTVFDAASLTKPVFAYAVLRLADRGELDLDRPIAATLPNERMTHDARYQRITPRMVLAHSTGLPNWGGDTLSLTFEPGTDWGYSGEGYVWLADAVEKQTRLTLQQLLTREVFEPLGMHRSTVVWDSVLEENGSAYHSPWGDARPRQPPATGSRTANAAASLRTTARDYATFVAAVMDGRGLRPAMARQYLSVQNEAANAANYRARPADLRARIAWGLGWGLERGDDGIRFWHWGDNGDAKAFVIGDLARRDAVVYFANAQGGLAPAHAIVRAVLPARPYALEWLRYQRHDDHGFVARRALVHAGLSSDTGVSSVARAYARQRDSMQAAMTPALIQSAAVALGSRRSVASADTLLALAMRDFPDTASLWLDRGELHLRAGDPGRALPFYERAARMAPADSSALARVRWAKEMITARKQPVDMDERTLGRYVGVYGPRVITLEDGRLHYQRGSGRKTALIPMTDNTFSLEGNPTFRVRFIAEPGTAAHRIVGLYHDGSEDGHARSARPE